MKIIIYFNERVQIFVIISVVTTIENWHREISRVSSKINRLKDAYNWWLGKFLLFDLVFLDGGRARGTNGAGGTRY